MCGITWRRMIRLRVAPIACAASMNGRARIRSASLRSRRAYQGTETSATPIAAVLEADAEADRHRHRQDQRREGEDRVHRRASRRRRSTPPTVPASSPIRPPISAPATVTTLATSERDARAVGEAGEHVAPELVGAHRVRRRGGASAIDQFLRDWVRTSTGSARRSRTARAARSRRSGRRRAGRRGSRARRPGPLGRRWRRTARPGPADGAQGRSPAPSMSGPVPILIRSLLFDCK